MTEVEVDEILGFVSDVRAIVSANDTMPSWVVLLVKFLLDGRGNVFLNIVPKHRKDSSQTNIKKNRNKEINSLCQGLSGQFDRFLLHFLGHVRVLDHRLPVDRSAHCFGR